MRAIVKGPPELTVKRGEATGPTWKQTCIALRAAAEGELSGSPGEAALHRESGRTTATMAYRSWKTRSYALSKFSTRCMKVISKALYGFRPGRSQHRALDALYMGLMKRKSWVLDADIRGCFDAIDHGWLISSSASDSRQASDSPWVAQSRRAGGNSCDRARREPLKEVYRRCYESALRL